MAQWYTDIALKCENEQIIKRNTTETDWEWDEKKKEYKLLSVLRRMYWIFALMLQPHTCNVHLFLGFLSPKFFYASYSFRQFTSSPRTNSWAHEIVDKTHTTMTRRRRRRQQRQYEGSPFAQSGPAADDKHRTEATSYTYYPFTRIFIRILCFPFGPFKYTYRLYSFMYRYGNGPRRRRRGRACECKHTVRNVRT